MYAAKKSVCILSTTHDDVKKCGVDQMVRAYSVRTQNNAVFYNILAEMNAVTLVNAHSRGGSVSHCEVSQGLGERERPNHQVRLPTHYQIKNSRLFSILKFSDFGDFNSWEPTELAAGFQVGLLMSMSEQPLLEIDNSLTCQHQQPLYESLKGADRF